MLSLLSSVCRQNDFRAILKTNSSKFWTQWSLAMNSSWYCNPTRFQTRGPKEKKKIDVSVICTQTAYFSSDLDGVFCNQFLKKRHFRKVHSIVILLLPFWHKSSSKAELKNLNFWGYFILKKDLKGEQILKFRIFGRQMSKMKGSSILLYPTHYCVQQQFTVSNKMQCPHF